jgi:hypothetical protein
LTIGAMTPAAPASRRRLASENSPTGADDRRLAGQRDRENGARGADEVEHPVLQVEHDGVEWFTRQRFRDRRLVHDDPGAEERRLRPQTRRQHSNDRVAHPLPSRSSYPHRRSLRRVNLKFIRSAHIIRIEIR